MPTKLYQVYEITLENVTISQWDVYVHFVIVTV